MLLNDLSEMVWRYYNEGRASATNQNFSQKDIAQMLRTACAERFRQLYYAAKKLNNGDEYYFSSPLLSIQTFKLTEPNAMGMQRADMSEFDLYRLPKNSHIVNVYPNASGCSGDDGTIDITQVQPAEENFYLSSDYDFYIFYVVKGRGINIYHLPPCVTSVDIEATFDNVSDNDIDITLDVAFVAAQQVLGIVLRVPGFANDGVDNPYRSAILSLKAKLQPEQQTQDV